MKSEALKTGERTLIPRLWIARDFFSRFKGLMGRRGLPDDEAILFPKCNSIHTFFMRFPIDVVRVDANGKVIDVKVVRPWRMMAPSLATKHIIEMREARSRELGISTGTQLKVNGVWG